MRHLVLILAIACCMMTSCAQFRALPAEQQAEVRRKAIASAAAALSAVLTDLARGKTTKQTTLDAATAALATLQPTPP